MLPLAQTPAPVGMCSLRASQRAHATRHALLPGQQGNGVGGAG